MIAVLLTIHVLACVAMIGMILLQRSEGGGLGLGTGGGVSGLMSGRGAANAMTRTTVMFAAIFITTSIALALMAKTSRTANPLAPTTTTPAGGGLLPTLPSSPAPTTPTPSPASPSAIPVPSAPAPAAPATPPAAQPGAQPAPSAPPPREPSN